MSSFDKPCRIKMFDSFRPSRPPRSQKSRFAPPNIPLRAVTGAPRLLGHVTCAVQSCLKTHDGFLTCNESRLC